MAYGNDIHELCNIHPVGLAHWHVTCMHTQRQAKYGRGQSHCIKYYVYQSSFHTFNHIWVVIV